MKTCIECFGEFKDGLSVKEIKELFKIEFGKNWHNKWRSFCKFMKDQTSSEVEGITIFYRCDVINFMRPKGERFFD